MSLFCPDCRQTYDDLTLRVCPTDGTRLYVLESHDSDDPLLGATIDGRFQIEHSIGVGGMGTVYRARQLSVGRDVAVKVLRAELSGKEVALERFFREAKTISNLTHPNIVRLIDFGQDRDFDVLFLAMELVEGVNLGDLLRTGRLRVALALEVAYQVCGALTEPHAAGVIHRDLKPDNLLLMPVSDGTVQTKVLDFGIARALETNDTTLTATGMICGTPAYMAPEQAQNEELDPRTDLYALGVILYEMLSGWPPFSGTSSLQIMLKHIQEMPVALRDLLPPATLPPEVEELVYALMNKDRSKRPGSAREVRDRIDDLRSQFDFGRVRIEESGAVDDFVLRKLPRGETSASGPTEVLRRETGIEEMLTGHQTGGLKPGVVPDSTVDEMDHHTTFPFTPDERGEVRSDARIKVSTRGGAQQAWTPGDQAAARVKNTDKNFAPDERVDAFGETEIAGETPGERVGSLESGKPGKPGKPEVGKNGTARPEARRPGAQQSGVQQSEAQRQDVAGSSAPRKTLVEESPRRAQAPADRTDTADKLRPSAADRELSQRKPADTSETRIPVVDDSSSGVSLPLLLALAITVIFVAGAAIVVVMELRSLNAEKQSAAESAKALPETTPAEVELAVESIEMNALPEGARQMAIERGASWAGGIGATGRHVAQGVAQGIESAREERASKRAKSSSRKPATAQNDTVEERATSKATTTKKAASEGSGTDLDRQIEAGWGPE